MGPLPFNLEFFTECQDMRQLLAYLDAPPDTGEALDGAEDDEEQDDQSRGRKGSSETGGGSESHRQDGGEAEAAGRADDRSGSGGGAAGDGDGGGRRRGRNERFHKLTEEICDVVDSYGLVCFYPLNIQVRLYHPPRSLFPSL